MEPRGHVNVVHWDDVPWRDVEEGEGRCGRQLLGDAAGAFRAGVSRLRLAPHGRSTAVHGQADEEEIFYVLGGSGLSRQDGVTCEVGPGDTLCHRVHEEAHALTAGPDGLEVLAFGPRDALGVTSGPRPRPDAPTAARPARICHADSVEGTSWDRPGYEGLTRDLGLATGSVTTGLQRFEIEAGAQSAPLHWHTMEEELFVVLDGTGEVQLGEHRHAVRAGTVVARPPQVREAHAFFAWDDGLTVLAWGTRVPGDIVYYPRSQKLSVHGLMFRVEPLEYWDGE